MGSWAGEDIAGIAGWRISCLRLDSCHTILCCHSLFYKVAPNVRLIRCNPAAAAAPVCFYLRLLWHQPPIKLGYLGGQRKGWRPDLFQSAFPLSTSRLEAPRQTGSLKGVRLIGSEAHLVLVLCSLTDCCLRSLDREICQDHPFRYRLTIGLGSLWRCSILVGQAAKICGPPWTGHLGYNLLSRIDILHGSNCPPVVFFSVKCVTEHLNLHATSESGHDAHVMGGLIWVNTLLLSTGTFKPSQSPGSVPGRIIQGNALG